MISFIIIVAMYITQLIYHKVIAKINTTIQFIICPFVLGYLPYIAIDT